MSAQLSPVPRPLLLQVEDELGVSEYKVTTKLDRLAEYQFIVKRWVGHLKWDEQYKIVIKNGKQIVL